MRCSVCVLVCQVLTQTSDLVLQPNPKVPPSSIGGTLSGVQTEPEPCRLSLTLVSLKVNSWSDTLTVDPTGPVWEVLFLIPSGSARSFGSIRSSGACCPRPRTRPRRCTAWGSSPRTTWWPSPASGTSCPSWGKWRRRLERSSTAAWWVDRNRGGVRSWSEGNRAGSDLSGSTLTGSDGFVWI